MLIAPISTPRLMIPYTVGYSFCMQTFKDKAQSASTGAFRALNGSITQGR